MNKQRRKAIDVIMDRIQKLNTADLTAEVDSICDDLDQLRTEEEEYRDNMSENLQNGEKYNDSEHASQKMDNVFEKLDALRDALNEIDIDDMITDLDDAKAT